MSQDKRELYSKIKNTLQNNRMDYNNLNYLEKLLQRYSEYKNFNEIFYHKSMAKVYYAKSYYTDAEKEAKKAIELDDTCSSAYFVLFKISLKKQNFEEAYKYLSKFKVNINEHKCNLDVYFYLFDIINGKEPEKIKFDNYIMGISFKNNKTLSSKWNEFVKNLNDKDFAQASLSFKSCRCLIECAKMNIDFEIFDILLSKIKEIYNINDIDVAYNYIFSERFYYEKIYFIDKLITQKKLDKAYEEINKIVANTPELELFVDLYKKRISERKIGLDYVNNTEALDNFELAKEYEQAEDLERAYEFYKKAYEKSKHPSLLYKMGKCKFYIGDQEETKTLLEEATKICYKKLIKSYMLLGKCSKVYSKEEIQEINNKMIAISKIKPLTTGYKLRQLSQKKDGKNLYFDLDSIDEEYNINFENINYTESLEELKKKFYESDEQEKINIIIYLYKANYKLTADYLCKEYKNQYGYDKKIEHVEKNKKLYLAKGIN